MKKTRINLIATELRPRHLKISKAIDRRNYEVIFHLLADDNIVDLCGNEAIHFISVDDLLENIKSHGKAINHYLGVWNNDFAIQLIQNSQYPFVYETYDQFYGCCNPEHPDYPTIIERKKEVFCFQKADFVTYRDYRFTHLNSELIRNKPNATLLLDGCLTNESYGKLKQLNTNNIKFVYCGNIPEPESKTSRNYHLELANRVAKYGAEYHVYPLHKKVVTQYRERQSLLRNQNNFFIHEPLPYPNLILELSKYDVGVDFLSINGGRQPDGIDFYSRQCSNYACNNKLFDYIDAGLQIITHKTEFNKSIFSKTEGIHFIENFDEIWTKLSSTTPRSMIPSEFKLTHMSQVLQNIYTSLIV